jgi:hypothetical protein
MIELIETKDCIEYKNGHYAVVYKVIYKGAHLGWYYSDRGVKDWYQFFLDECYHMDCKDIVDEHKSSLTYFGEDCIYTHGIYASERIAEYLYEKYYKDEGHCKTTH